MAKEQQRIRSRRTSARPRRTSAHTTHPDAFRADATAPETCGQGARRAGTVRDGAKKGGEEEEVRCSAVPPGPRWLEQHTQAEVQSLTLGARGRDAAAMLASRGAGAGDDTGTVLGAITTESSRVTE